MLKNLIHLLNITTCTDLSNNDVGSNKEKESMSSDILTLDKPIDSNIDGDIINVLITAFKITHKKQNNIDKNTFIKAIFSILRVKNEREAHHCKRVAKICKKIALAMNLPKATIKEMETIGLMHDIGKIAIRNSILDKNGMLTCEEKEEISLHPEIGYKILSASNKTLDFAYYVLTHHEHFDGTGYPYGITGSEIPLQSRILAVADAYDAMTSARAYRQPLDKQLVLEELRNNAGTQFDPQIIQLFIDKVLYKKL